MRSHGICPARPVDVPGWARTLASRLVRHAARSGPPSLTERLEEEWLADLEAQHGCVMRWRFALGCCWATLVITREHCAASAPAANSATGSKTMTLYPPSNLSAVPRRTSTFLLVVCLHILVIYGVASGLASNVVTLLPTPMQTIIIDEPRQIEKPTPLPPPARLAPLRLDPLPPPVPVPVEPELNTAPTPGPPAEFGDLPRPPAPQPVLRVQGGPGRGFPDADDYYPPQAIRGGLQGIATVQVCVDANGRLTADPTLAESSGMTSLDAGALRLARAGSGHYRATTENSRPISACFPFRVRFNLKN